MRGEKGGAGWRAAKASRKLAGELRVEGVVEGRRLGLISPCSGSGSANPREEAHACRQLLGQPTIICTRRISTG